MEVNGLKAGRSPAQLQVTMPEVGPLHVPATLAVDVTNVAPAGRVMSTFALVAFDVESLMMTTV
jgi:hypothetical protein